MLFFLLLISVKHIDFLSFFSQPYTTNERYIYLSYNSIVQKRRMEIKKINYPVYLFFFFREIQVPGRIGASIDVNIHVTSFCAPAK